MSVGEPTDNESIVVTSMNRNGRPKGMTPVERFWEKVDKGPECWTWKGALNNAGYGRFAITSTREDVRLVLSHRYVWELAHGPIPAGLHVLHACDTPSCVRPNHLLLGTNQANMIDASRKGRIRNQYTRRTLGPVGP